MTGALDYVLHVADCISLLIILPGYMFILVVNIQDWMKNKKLDVSDQLISGLGLLSLIHRLFQVSFRCTVLRHGFTMITSFAWLVIDITYLTLIFCTLLFSTWLSIHFCLKIVTLNNKLYIYIQRMFPKVFPWILLPSILASLLVSGPAAQTLVTVVSMYRHIHHMQNNSSNFRSESVEAHVTAVKTLLSLLTFNLLYFASVVVTIEDYGRLQWISYVTIMISLRRHIKQMRDNAEGSSSNVNVHIHAVKILTLSFLYDVIYFAAMMIAGLNDNDIVAYLINGYYEDMNISTVNYTGITFV
ncbi:taste receptor type 2 member 2-like [Engystomops pustulosus]|uniref:taste receptor type 2 member 2-like n=1 Tax=Engystomops pustulosus TaxID=76066 RepID=UPI003AFB028F